MLKAFVLRSLCALDSQAFVCESKTSTGDQSASKLEKREKDAHLRSGWDGNCVGGEAGCFAGHLLAAWWAVEEGGVTIVTDLCSLRGRPFTAWPFESVWMSDWKREERRRVKNCANNKHLQAKLPDFGSYDQK